MYHLYHTEALVLGGTPNGEGSRYISLFTREFGLVIAKAQSVREERSKLRYGLQDFSLSLVTLVRGKELWRITNATITDNLFAVFKERPALMEMFARVFLLLRRLLAGEERNERLFLYLTETISFLKEHPVSFEVQSSVEIILVLRILYTLGYLAPRGEFAVFLDDSMLWDDRVLEKASSLRALALEDINHSLHHSQL